ncbi:ADP-ribosylglycohydrolase family protein [Halalkalirubrum salinum]|uniref:ADP-ribosylglycohydrolase family protein n=1 Tax=Halalkalirubrum salinum TaxID=2563889 RepID=UPI0010FADEB8|nr:ADP-ribosylglycohydrolase family protein [Halalkalirubrum salinum]
MVSHNSATGVLCGLACGDALGRPVEFRSAEWIAAQHGKVTEMLGHGSHGQPAGTVTDDTDLALCIARSLVEREAFDGQDIADRFRAWYESGPFDIGLMTADSLRAYDRGVSWREAGRTVWRDRPEGQNAGNGSVMRCAPHGIAFAADFDTLVQVSKQSSAITHYDPRCTYGCVILNCTIAGYLRGVDKPLETAIDRVRGEAPDELITALQKVPDTIDDKQLKTTGYAVHTIQTALYDAITAETAEDAIITAVNRGGDTDTVGAVTGALAGARFGSDALPDRWLEAIEYCDELTRLDQALATTDITGSV